MGPVNVQRPLLKKSPSLSDIRESVSAVCSNRFLQSVADADSNVDDKTRVPLVDEYALTLAADEIIVVND